MPGIPLVTRETSYYRNSDQMCRHEAHAELSQEEQVAAEESFSVYCKPIELYNIMQYRAIEHPSFLQRCLHYKLQAKNKRRIQMSVSISGDDGIHTHRLFPMYILLARAVSNTDVERQIPAIYHFKRACRLTAFEGRETVSSGQAKFILPEISELSSATVKSGSLDVLLVSCANTPGRQGTDQTKDHVFSASTNFEGCCLVGKIPMDVLWLSWERSPNLCLGEKVKVISSVSMQSCFMKLGCTDVKKYVSFQYPKDSEVVRVRVSISAEELGAKDISAYNMYSRASSNSASNIARLRFGNVIFNYKYYNNRMQKTEVTEDFICSICLVRCASFTGLKCHMTSTHDLLNYEFQVNENCQVINVTVKASAGNSEIVVEHTDPRHEAFFMCIKPLGHKKVKRSTVNTNPLLFASGAPDHWEYDTSCRKSTASEAAFSLIDSSSGQLLTGSNLPQPATLEFAKTRRLSIEQSLSKSQALLKKRDFFHSHRAQAMLLEQVLGDQDSEDEVDDDVADFEDRRMLEDFADVSKYEKQIMHLWNSFVRKQRVVADDHVPLACEAFSKLHGQELVNAPALLRTWRLLLIKFWNHGLLDPRTLNNCNLTLNQYQNQRPCQKSNEEVCLR